jgi:hypothetical protein|nr:MAG TPA: Stealth protein CR2, conserved region 2 [Caudoviricetes sp.]
MTTKKTASKSKDVKEVKTVETAETQVNESRAVQASGAVADESPVLEKKAQDHTTVVIPYCKEFAQGRELLFALRSWYEKTCFPANLVIIGDREDWFGEEIFVIEHQRTSDNSQIDTMEKLKLAIESPEVTERFIWTNDDIYLVNRVSLAHIEIPKVLGDLNPKKFKGVYAENMSRTIMLLDKFGLPKLNYGTHTPVLFEKFKLVEMLERFPEAESGVLFSSLYFNSQAFPAYPIVLDWETDQFLLPVISQKPNEERAIELLQRKVFLNNTVSGHSAWLEKFLEQMFPEPSIFEE